MIVIRDKAEDKFLRALNPADASRLGQRVLILALSEAESDDTLEHNVLMELERVLDDKMARYYLCRDGDIVCMGDKITPAQRNAIMIWLQERLSRVDVQAMVTLYELRSAQRRLHQYCQEKFTAMREQEALEQQKLREMRRQEILATPMDTAHFVEMVSQRGERREPTVLLSEDDPFSRRMVSGALGKAVNLLQSEDGTDTLLTYQLHAPDILFLDIELPDVSGQDLLKKIIAFDPEAYIVMLSGNGNRENILKAMENGAKGFVGKPFTREKLLHYINNSPSVMARVGDAKVAVL